LKKEIKMESIRIEILNPKAKSLLKSLADLNLIKIKKDKINIEFNELLARLRKKSDDTFSLDDISNEVESVRAKRHEK
jgi:hypothetical protein